MVLDIVTTAPYNERLPGLPPPQPPTSFLMHLLESISSNIRSGQEFLCSEAAGHFSSLREAKALTHVAPLPLWPLLYSSPALCSQAILTYHCVLGSLPQTPMGPPAPPPPRFAQAHLFPKASTNALSQIPTRPPVPPLLCYILSLTLNRP